MLPGQPHNPRIVCCFTFNIFAFFSVVEGTEDNSSDEDAEEVREVTKLLSGGIMETQFGDLNVFANANRDTPTPPMTGMNILLEFYLMEVRNQ